MLRNLNVKMMIAAASLALGVAGCLGGSQSGGGSTGTGTTGGASDPSNGSLGIAGSQEETTGAINNTFELLPGPDADPLPII